MLRVRSQVIAFLPLMFIKLNIVELMKLCSVVFIEVPLYILMSPDIVNSCIGIPGRNKQVENEQAACTVTLEELIAAPALPLTSVQCTVLIYYKFSLLTQKREYFSKASGLQLRLLDLAEWEFS